MSRTGTASIRLVLASTSPRRRDLLTEAGLLFSVDPSQVEEIFDPEIPGRHLARINAELKANDVALRHPDEVVLAADTLVVLDDKTFGKPRDLAEAREMLTQLCGRVHEVVTSVCILQQSENRMCAFTESTLVKFRPAEEIDLDAYLADAQPLDKAGAYAAQDDNGRLIERLEGHMSNVIGLPIEQVLTALRNHFPAAALHFDTSEASDF